MLLHASFLPKLRRMAFDFLKSLALDGNEDVGIDSGDESDIDIEVGTEGEPELDYQTIKMTIQGHNHQSLANGLRV